MSIVTNRTMSGRSLTNWLKELTAFNGHFGIPTYFMAYLHTIKPHEKTHGTGYITCCRILCGFRLCFNRCLRILFVYDKQINLDFKSLMQLNVHVIYEIICHSLSCRRIHTSFSYNLYISQTMPYHTPRETFWFFLFESSTLDWMNITICFDLLTDHNYTTLVSNYAYACWMNHQLLAYM